MKVILKQLKLDDLKLEFTKDICDCIFNEESDPCGNKINKIFNL